MASCAAAVLLVFGVAACGSGEDTTAEDKPHRTVTASSSPSAAPTATPSPTQSPTPTQRPTPAPRPTTVKPPATKPPATTTRPAPRPTPAPTTHSPTPRPAPTPTAWSGACEIVSNAGNCYSAGQFCRNVDVGSSTHAANGRIIHCRDEGDRNRWGY